MTRLAVVLLSAAVAVAQSPKATTHQIKLDEHTFTLPVGFTIERVAGPPLVDRPIVASFDDRGRLYVADSSGSNEKVAEQLKNPTHRIVRLEDADGDGKYEKSTVFADKMMFPEGILWHRGHVYCAAPPHIWKLTDTDDDGKADKREIWFDGKTLTGCANDLHGPYLGPDGWLYWCKGAFAKQEYTLPNGKKFTTRASHIFRARPDGTGIEPVMTGGMDNPVDVAFLPNGERFFTTTFFQHPAAGRRDGLIHAIYGGIYGKDHDVIRDPDHKWTSPNLMPVLTHMGPAAPCGLHCYESDAFGKEYTSNLFACQFNLRKVSRHVLKPSGSTYTSEDSDFVVSDNTDFHPTDVIEDADGSLLIVNTGGWYKLCCPSSQLVKADVLGAIYRVRRTDAQYEARWLPSDAVLARTSDQSLIARYKAARSQLVRDRIGEYAVERLGASALSLLFKDFGTFSPAQAQAAIWNMGRLNSDYARKHVRSRLEMATVAAQPEESVLVAAIQTAGLNLDRDTVPFLTKMLGTPSLLVRRVAAEALGRIGDDRAVQPILKAIADEKNDRALDHSLTYALIELDNREYLKNSLDHENPRVRRACLTALDQLGEKLDPKVVLAAMKSDNAELRETATWIISRHPEWADEVVGTFREAIADPKGELPAQIARFGGSRAIQDLLAETAWDAKASDASRIAAMQAMAAANLKTPPTVWYTALEGAMNYEESVALKKAALTTLRDLPPPKKVPETLAKTIVELTRDTTDREVVLRAFAALPAGTIKVTNTEMVTILSSAERDNIASIRSLAVDALTKVKLEPALFKMIVDALPRMSPLDLDRVLSAFAQTKDDEIGKKLIAALGAPAVRPAIRIDSVKERIKHFGPAVHAEAEKLYAELNKDHEKQRARLDEAMKTLATGDVRRGQAIFNSAKTSCIACHTIGYVGGKQGPDLTRIGGIRSERDLLESILFPSASFVRSYEPVIVTTKDEKSYSGVPKKDAPDEMILVIAADKEIRIPREEIEEVRPGRVSIMPDGLDKQLSPQELADLIAFLRACK
jgi:putative membrane-bound dehydrogenase-like protein